MIVTDASPVNFLVTIGSDFVLPLLFDTVLLPRCVELELNQTQTPEAVRRFVASPPSWLSRSSDEGLQYRVPSRGAGERHALALARQTSSLLLTDDRGAIRLAEKDAVSTIGTVGVLFRAAELHLVDFPSALKQVREAGLYLAGGLEISSLNRWERRRL